MRNLHSFEVRKISLTKVVQKTVIRLDLESLWVVYMSVTLRDAQHLCWKNFKKINEKLDPERGKLWTPFVMVADLLEEAGEVAAVVKGLEGFKPPEKPKTKEMLATELSDLLYILFVLAEHYGIELEETFLQTVNDYILRFIK
jgi:NTP pyrophosphatase (non-canonical NTP hydrolase)